MTARSLTFSEAAALFDELLTPPHLRDPLRPVLILEERDDAFVMRAEVPALRPEDLEIYVGEDYLELAGEQRVAARARCCLLRTASGVSFSRRYPLSLPVVPERSDARLVSGRFHLRLPKRVGASRGAAPRMRVQVSG